MFERLLLVWLVLLSLLAYQWPAWLPGLWDPFVETAPWLSYLFTATMLAIGSLLPRDEIVQVALRWPTVLGGTLVQYTAMPLLAYLLGLGFGLEGVALVGLMMAGCVPGAMASNVLTLMARGNVSYSVSLTTSATLLSPLAVPLALWLTVGRSVEDFPAAEVIIRLCWMVVIPVIAGHALSRASSVWARGAKRVGAVVANLTILWIIAVVVGKNRDNLHPEAALLAALLLLNLGGYLAGTFGGLLLRLPPAMRRALTLEVGMQNAGLGTVLAMELFPGEPSIAIAPACYTFGCMFTGTVLARVWAELASRAEEGTPPDGPDAAA